MWGQHSHTTGVWNVISQKHVLPVSITRSHSSQSKHPSSQLQHKNILDKQQMISYTSCSIHPTQPSQPWKQETPSGLHCTNCRATPTRRTHTTKTTSGFHPTSISPKTFDGAGDSNSKGARDSSSKGEKDSPGKAQLQDTLPQNTNAIRPPSSM